MKIRDLEWWIIGVLWLCAFGLAINGFYIIFSDAGIERNFLDIAFQSMKLFATEFVDDFTSPLPWQLEIARWLAPGVLAYTALRTVFHFIRREFNNLRLKGYKNHIIITSLNERSRYLVKDLLANNEKVIVIAGIENPQKFDAVEKDGAVVVEGNLSDRKFLKNIAASNAKYFIFIDDDDEKNISSAISIYNYLNLAETSDEKIIFTHIADDIKLNELIELNFFEEQLDGNLNKANCEIRIFSINERTSRILFNDYAPDTFTPITSADSPQTHIALFGSNNLTQSFILRTAKLGHFINFKKVKITLFHEDDSVIKKLEQNFPSIFNLVELVSIEKPLSLFDINEFNKLHTAYNFSAVYLLCKDDSLSSGILKKLINVETEEKLNVILTLTNPDGILSKWYAGAKLNNINLIKFNITERTFTKEAVISEKLDSLAKVIHNKYLSGFDKSELDPINKATHREWKYLTVDAKNQNREQADHLYIKLRAMNCIAVKPEKLTNGEFDIKSDKNLLELLSKAEHNRWWASKLLAGWRYAAKEDGTRKLHDDLIEYEKLSEDVKEWDRKAVLNMPVLLSELGLAIKKVDREK